MRKVQVVIDMDVTHLSPKELTEIIEDALANAKDFWGAGGLYFVNNVEVKDTIDA